MFVGYRWRSLGLSEHCDKKFWLAIKVFISGVQGRRKRHCPGSAGRCCAGGGAEHSFWRWVRLGSGSEDGRAAGSLWVATVCADAHGAHGAGALRRGMSQTACQSGGREFVAGWRGGCFGLAARDCEPFQRHSEERAEPTISGGRSLVATSG